MRFSAFSTVTLFALALAGQAAAAVVVPIDQTMRVSFSGAAETVFIGNPSVADAVIVDSHSLMLTGRGYGVTNLLVVDHAGRTIFNQEVMVSAHDAGRVTVQHGASILNYTCTPRCERTPMPGEGSDTFGAYAGPYDTYAGRARSGTK